MPVKRKPAKKRQAKVKKVSLGKKIGGRVRPAIKSRAQRIKEAARKF